MVKVDGIQSEYVLAAEGLSFDKLGNENGYGSHGLIVEYGDGLTAYIGLKLDVITIRTNEFVSTFYNITSDDREAAGLPSDSREFGEIRKTVVNTEPSFERVAEAYINDHKFEIDIAHLYKTVYFDIDASEKYLRIKESFLLRSKFRRNVRYVSAILSRTLNGNLEDFSYIADETGKKYFVANGSIVDKELIADEIRYSIWLVPHDELGYRFMSKNLPIQPGQDIAISATGSSLIGETSIQTETIDRRVARRGYYDVTVQDPVVNVGYTHNGSVIGDTFIINNDLQSDIQITHAKTELNASDSMVAAGVILSSMSKTSIDGYSSAAIRRIVELERKRAIVDAISTKRTDGYMQAFEDAYIDRLSALVDALFQKGTSSIKENLESVIRDTAVMPLALMSIQKNMHNVDIDSVYDSVAILYNPVLDTFAFYEIEASDVADISRSRMIVGINGTAYGFDSSAGASVYLWNNIEKEYRVDNVQRWSSVLGITAMLGVPATASSPEDREFAHIDSGYSLYEDLRISGKYAKIMVIKRSDIYSLLRKKNGIFASEFVLGYKAGIVSINRSGLWM